MKIWILKIDTKKSGDIITAHTSQERAKDELYNYVDQNWDQGITDQYGTRESLTSDEAIEAYFDCWGDALDGEWYILDELELHGAENLITPSTPLMTALDDLEQLLAPQHPRLAVVIEGGVVSSVIADHPELVGLQVTIIDYDTEGADECDLSTVKTLLNAGEQQAFVRTDTIEKTAIDLEAAYMSIKRLA